MEIKLLSLDNLAEFKTLIQIFKEVLEHEHPVANDEQLKSLLSNPDFFVFVVMDQNGVIGGLTIYVLHTYFGQKPLAYIYDVGISPEFQGKGLGKRLITEVCKFCKRNKFQDAYVEAESDDIDAVAFYRKTRFSSEMNAIHFTYNFSE